MERKWIWAVAPSVAHGMVFFDGHSQSVANIEFRPPVAHLNGPVEWRFKESCASSAYVKPDEPQLLEDRIFNQIFSDASKAVGGVAETLKSFGKRIPAYVFKASPKLKPSWKVLGQVNKAQREILEEKKNPAHIREADRYFMALYESGEEWEGVRETLTASKLTESSGSVELNADCAEIPKHMLEKEWDLRRAFSQQLSILEPRGVMVSTLDSQSRGPGFESRAR